MKNIKANPANKFARKLTQADNDCMRDMHEEYPVGHPDHLGYKKLAVIFECSASHARYVCRYLPHPR